MITKIKRGAIGVARSVYQVGKVVSPPEVLICFQHRRAHGYWPDLRDPKTFNEKIQWRKLNDRNPLMSRLVDKIEAKSIVQRLVGPEYITPTYWQGGVDDLFALSEVSQPYVFKASHTSGDVLVVSDPKNIDLRELTKLGQRWLNRKFLYQSSEWAYSGIPPRLLAEEKLTVNGSSPSDYKFFCVNGYVEFIQVDLDRFSKHKRLILDKNWSDTGITYEYKKTDDGIVPARPVNLEEMIFVAEKISKDFDFVRVDLYDVNGQVRFGEATFYPGAGLEVFSIESDEDNLAYRNWTRSTRDYPGSYDIDKFIGRNWTVK